MKKHNTCASNKYTATAKQCCTYYLSKKTNGAQITLLLIVLQVWPTPPPPLHKTGVSMTVIQHHCLVSNTLCKPGWIFPLTLPIQLRDFCCFKRNKHRCSPVGRDGHRAAVLWRRGGGWGCCWGRCRVWQGNCSMLFCCHCCNFKMNPLFCTAYTKTCLC